MGRIALRKKHSDTTAVSNAFIDEYMTDANEAQIKIYLYLLRCLEDDLPISVSILADRFNFTEKDVLRSLVYWERKGILSIEYDSENNLVGICVGDCVKNKSTTIAGTSSSAEAVVAPVEAVVTSVDSATAPVPAKPFYSLEQMTDFKNRSEIGQLMYMTQQYMGKPLSTSDVNSLLYMYDALSFPVDLMEYVIEYCVNGGHKSMRYIEKVAIAWSEQGISTVSQAKSMGSDSRYRQEGFAILRAFGITGRTLVDSDMAFTRRWIEEYGFDLDIILEACKRTLLAISKPSFNYADSILKRWNEEGVHHLNDLQAADDKFKKENGKSSRVAASHNRGSAQTKFGRDVDYNSIAADIMEHQPPLSKTQ